MKINKNVISVYLMLACSLTAASISFDSIGSQWEDSTGNAFADGNQILIGNFDTSGAFNFGLIGTEAFDTYSEVLPFFTTYGSDLTETVAGVLVGAQQGGVGTSNDTGSQIFFWAFNDPDLSSATEWAIVRNTDSTWMVPADPVPGTTNIDLGANTPTRIIEFGAESATVSLGGSLNVQSALVSAVPEPSTYALFAGILSIGFVAVRRHRSRSQA